MWCGLCGSECQRRDGSSTSTASLPLSGRTMCDMLADLGHPVPEGALLCRDCVGLVRELDRVLEQGAQLGNTISGRAMMKAENDARRLEEQALATQCEVKQVEHTNKGPADSAAAKDEQSGGQSTGDGPPEGAAPDGEAAQEETPRPRARTRRRPKRRLVKAPLTKTNGLGQGDGQDFKTDPAEKLTDSASQDDCGTGGEVRRDPGVAKKEPVEGGERLDGGDGDAGDCVSAESGVDGSHRGQGPGAADSSREIGEDSEGRGQRSREAPSDAHPTVSNASSDSKRPDWNERWRNKLLKQTSWRDLWDGLDSQRAMHAERTHKEAPADEQSQSQPATQEAEPGSGAAASSSPPACENPVQKLFRVGRKVVTKQLDGSAMPAVKVMRKNRRGQPHVAFLHPKKALLCVEEVASVADCGLPSGPVVSEEPDGQDTQHSPPAPKRRRPPTKRRRPPRVLTKPGPSELLPSEVTWMASGPEDHPWLAPEGAVHAVLDVQPGEAWVDAIVRSEAAAEQGWGKGEQQMPVPLADIKAEPPE